MQVQTFAIRRSTMGTIYTSVEQLIGGTPLLELRQIQRAEGLNATLLA